jgi:hypothetical protein
MSSRAAAQRRIYHVDLAPHLLNVHAPNALYPGIGLRWADTEWCRLVDMVQAFGFNVFAFPLDPGLMTAEGTETEAGQIFRRQMRAVAAYARRQGMDVELLLPLATVGPRRCCPNDAEEWRLAERMWATLPGLYPEIAIVGITTGVGCTRNGCSEQTYVDRSQEAAASVLRQLPNAAVELHTLGIAAWGGADSHPESRARAAVQHLCHRLPDFPHGTSVALTPEGTTGEPVGPWSEGAREIARTHRVHVWDPGLTEPEGPVLPRYPVDRLYQQRRAMAAGSYGGGACTTASPLLNQLSAFVAARSFLQPETAPGEMARGFLQGILGTQGRAAAETLPLFEPELPVGLGRGEYHKRMAALLDLLSSLKARSTGPFHPEPEAYRKELVFYARLYRDLSDRTPDYDELRQRYWYHVYRIHDRRPDGVDPRPSYAADQVVARFRDWPV